MRIALAGAGAFGEKHLDGLRNIDGVSVTSIIGRELEATRAVAAKYGIGHVTTDLNETLARDDVDAVILCTPTQMHAAQAIACMDAGKHVEVEIPLADSWADAQAVLENGARLAWSMRETGNIVYPAVDDVVASLAAQPPPAGPVILVEPSDNIGGGAPGDGTGVLRSLLTHRIPHSLVVINDQETVATLSAVTIGGTCDVRVGGKSWRGDAGPVPLAATLVSRSDGRFELEDPNSHLASMSGTRFEMGPCAVIRSAGVTILLTSRKTPPFDLGQLRSQGLEPRDFAVIGVKAAVAHKRAYDPITRASYYVDTPGPCSSNLATFPWRHLRRPVWPIDPDTAFTCEFS